MLTSLHPLNRLLPRRGGIRGVLVYEPNGFVNSTWTKTITGSLTTMAQDVRELFQRSGHR